jgi:UrcA family protein
MMEEVMKLIATATATIGLTLAATPALAQTPEQRTVTFQTSDIDLATPKGQKELNRRIDRAIRDVCQTRNLATGSRVPAPETTTCISQARNSAQAQAQAQTQSQAARLMVSEGQKGG